MCVRLLCDLTDTISLCDLAQGRNHGFEEALLLFEDNSCFLGEGGCLSRLWRGPMARSVSRTPITQAATYQNGPTIKFVSICCAIFEPEQEVEDFGGSGEASALQYRGKIWEVANETRNTKQLEEGSPTTSQMILHLLQIAQNHLRCGVVRSSMMWRRPALTLSRLFRDQ